MNTQRLISQGSGLVLAAALGLLSGCNESRSIAREGVALAGVSDATASGSVLSGTRIKVALSSNISSGTARVGDSWRGTVTENVMTPNEGAIPPGSEVEGVITGVTRAQRGVRAMLGLGVVRIRVNGHDEAITASTEPVLAGSARSRNLGAIGEGPSTGVASDAAAGNDEEAEGGGISTVAIAAGVVTGPRGGQVVLSDGTVVTFTVTQTVAMR